MNVTSEKFIEQLLKRRNLFLLRKIEENVKCQTKHIAAECQVASIRFELIDACRLKRCFYGLSFSPFFKSNSGQRNTFFMT